jgi:flagellar protein FliO/FliZ
MRRIHGFAAGLAGLLSPLGAWAAEVGSAAVAPAPVATSTAAATNAAVGTGMAGQLLQLVLGLGAVLLLIFVLAWFLRRVQRAAPRGGQVIELIGSKALGPRDRLVLVQVGNEQILLGLSPGSITPLHVLKEPVAVPEKPESPTPEFAQKLMELLGKDHKESK